MRKLIAVLFSLLIGLGLAQQDNADAPLLQGLTENEDFSTLVGLIDQAGLTADLEGAGPFTIFAPANSVFEELDEAVLEQLNNDPELLTSVLQSHVLQGAYEVIDLRDAEEGSIMTLQGEALETDLGAGGLTVGGASFNSTNVDNTYSNGIVHEVGDLVLPASLQSQLGVGDAETGGAETGGAETDDLDVVVAFVDLDTDASGTLTQEESQQAFRDNPDLFEQFDTDGSGDISEEEFNANQDLLGSADQQEQTETDAAVGAETGGAETGGAETGGAETGGAETTPQAATPTAAQQAVPNTARVRVAHLSPNAPTVDITLTRNVEGGDTLAPDELTGLSYEATTDYLEVQTGDYTVSVTSEGTPVLEEEVNFAPGLSYTVAAIGLVLPGEDAQAEEEEGGFFGFIQNLLGGGSERDALALQLLVLEDTLRSQMVEGDTLVRLVHAAPGTEAVDLTVTNPEDAAERQNVIDDVPFGEASDYTSLAEGFSEPAITIAGSEAVALDLSDTAFERGIVNTLFVTGTALEQAPLKVIAFSDEPQLDPTAVGVAAPATGPLGAADPLQQTVGDLVLADANLATLALALDQVGMLEALRQPGPFTLFAPSDEAFATLPQDQLNTLLADPEALTQVLNNHVVNTAVLSADAANAGTLTTLDGVNLEVASGEDGSVSIGNAAVVVADIQASNGVIHIIDTVLLPEGLELTQ